MFNTIIRPVSFVLCVSLSAANLCASTSGQDCLRSAYTLLAKLNLTTVIEIAPTTNAEHFAEKDPAKRTPRTTGTIHIIKNNAGKSHPYTIVINTEWFSEFSTEEQIFWVGHEIMHLLLGHFNNPGNSKQEEFEADIAAACLISHPQPAVASMLKAKEVRKIVENLAYTHPTFDERASCINTVSMQQQQSPHRGFEQLKNYYPEIHKAALSGYQAWKIPA